MFDAMQELVNSENIMVLTYNPVLGALWRLVINQRDDPRYADLKRAMGDSIRESQGNPERERILRDWLEASYDYTDEIENIIRNVNLNDDDEEEEKENSYFTLNVSNSKEHMPSLKDLRSIAQCPARGVLSKVQHLLLIITIAGFHVLVTIFRIMKLLLTSKAPMCTTRTMDMITS